MTEINSTSPSTLTPPLTSTPAFESAESNSYYEVIGAIDEAERKTTRKAGVNPEMSGPIVQAIKAALNQKSA